MVSTKGDVCFNNLNINNLDNTSGIFLGNNNANGWRSFIKENQGFGDASGCQINHTLNIVVDNDEVDTVIHDESPQSIEGYQLSPQPQNQMIQFQSMNVNAVNLNSAISVGENYMGHWHSNNKNNMGLGKAAGVNILLDNVNMIDDQDIIDTTIKGQRAFTSVQDNRSPS